MNKGIGGEENDGKRRKTRMGGKGGEGEEGGEGMKQKIWEIRGARGRDERERGGVEEEKTGVQSVRVECQTSASCRNLCTGSCRVMNFL